MDQRIQVVLTLMEERLHGDLSLEEMARFINLSSSRFRHLFKTETGVSFVRYLKSLRMHKAKELIETTFLSMKQVMRKVGIHDKRHFAKDFKKIYGLTPARYKLRYIRANHPLKMSGANK